MARVYGHREGPEFPESRGGLENQERRFGLLAWGWLSRWGEVHQDCGAEALDPSPDKAASICGSQSVLLGSVHVASLQGLSYEHRIPSAVLFQALG